ncbi:hypothetical protein Ahy_B09g099768 isoform D [Arachis hypogaea]|uniref:Uncharacterized protein n=1 Tax=Arachis hypogaea TaxID=3818 RepID=A0A444XUU1_ARAHY|nr:hypothetical protein Ahy_B09g099768 isoform D [Arachis hypogaea]
MAGNTRFDLSATSPEEPVFRGTFLNGQRGILMNGSLDRSASFCDGNEGQVCSTVSRGNYTSTGDPAPVAQYLILDPITMGDQKYTRSGELRRVLGITFGSTREDCAFGTANLKHPPPVATEELKRFKASVQEASARARYRSKRLDESLHKLKCWEALNMKKQLRNEILTNERLGGGPHFLKMGSQTHRNPSEHVNQRLEDRPKNVILNKRIRTSATEIRAEGQSTSCMRQPLAVGKDRDNMKDSSRGCDTVEEKMRKLPAGGETWDKKMKRKRSMGTFFSRSNDGEGELKRVMHLKLTNESGMQSSDAQGLRSGYTVGNSKLDVASLSTISIACATAKNEQEKVSRDSMDGLNNERDAHKGSKFNVRDNNYTGGTYALPKGKASRAPRTAPLMAGNSSSVSHSSETLETWEQPSSTNKPHLVTINRKRPLPAGSSSSPMAQWVGQRPQKISRTRRANVVSPVLNCDEVQVSLEGCSPVDVGTRMTFTTVSKDAVNIIKEGRVKHENVSSPTRLSESEESVAGENGECKLNEKGLGSNDVDERAINNSYNLSSPALATKKKKMPGKEIGDGLRRQGRSNRGASVSKNGISPVKEKLEIATLTKPIRSMKHSSEKNGSKSGRPPLKKSCDRKTITRNGLPSTSDSPDIAGESDDDREELLAAANFANIGCSSSFWKKLEPYFGPVNLEDIAYLKHLVKSTEEDHRCLSQMLGLGNDALDERTHTDNILSPGSLSGERERRVLNQTDSIKMSLMADMLDQHVDASFLSRQMVTEGNKVPPLYQRVLAALIIDDQIEETVGDGNMSFSEYEFNSNMVSCNGNASLTNGTAHGHEGDVFLQQMHQGPLHPRTEKLDMLSENGIPDMHRVSCSSSFNCDYEQLGVDDRILLELQSVGLYPDPVPGLADGDCEAIDQDILQLQKELHQQVTEKGKGLMKLIPAVEEGREMEQRALEQVAMEKLVELAYKKKLATRGSSAARNGLTKVAKPVALAFMKRTLARCRKFVETGRSCFLEPVFKDVLFASPARNGNAGPVLAVNLPQTLNSQQDHAFSGLFPCKEQDVLGNLDNPSDQDFARTGPILNRGKKKEVLLDDVSGCAALRSESTLGNSFMGGAKGKRSGRERDKGTSARNSASKGGRGERKTKAKPKQKSAQLSTSGIGSHSQLMENNNTEHKLASGSNEPTSSGSNKKSKVGSASHVSIDPEEPMDFANLHELDPMELGVDSELNGHQDLDSWLNIDEDGLQDDAVGLDIPMDDLSDLNMLL